MDPQAVAAALQGGAAPQTGAAGPSSPTQAPPTPQQTLAIPGLMQQPGGLGAAAHQPNPMQMVGPQGQPNPAQMVGAPSGATMSPQVLQQMNGLTYPPGSM